MKRFLDFINIPYNIKRYIYLKKIEKHTRGEESRDWSFIVDILIVLVFLAGLFYIYVINTNIIVKIAGILLILLLVGFFMTKTFLFVQKNEKKGKKVRELVLLSDRGESLKSWIIEGKTALLIGKNAKGNEVDIDMSYSEYASQISRQHALLNYTGEAWYIEDVGSTNGSGMKRANEQAKFSLEKERPYPVYPGDVIYIAGARLQAK